MRLLLLLSPLLVSFPALAGEVVLENEYVSVARDAAPCASAHVPECSDRVIVALGDIELASKDARRTMARGDIAVFGPGERIAPEKNAMRYEGREFFIFEEKLAPGDTRARHSHSQRVVIQLNSARLQQWPDGEPSKFVETVPDRPGFSAPVIHSVKNVGDTPLRGIVIEFQTQ